jgi:hypothetical protein
MKLVIGCLIVTYVISGCVAGDAVSHEDDPAAVKRDQGPALCRDGTVPPCTPRS